MKNHECLLLAVISLLFLPSTVWGQSQSRPGVTAVAQSDRLEIGPVPGLTTLWHDAPLSTAVPLGATLKFRVRTDGQSPVTWQGARVVDLGSTSNAELRLTAPGPRTVSVQFTDSQGEQRHESLELDVIDTGASPIRLSAARLWAEPVSVVEGAPNEVGLRHHFGDSIAATRHLGENRYRTSTRRWFQVAVDVEPAGFAPLVEWQLNGQAQRTLGASIEMQIFPARAHSLRPGAGANEELLVETYRVRILGREPAIEPWPDETSITFTAVTEPPGFEEEITWLASTKSGECQPAMGSGAEFTVSFRNTFGADGWRWLGVKADNAVAGQDEKCLGADCDGDGIANSEDNCFLNGNPLQVDTDLDGVGDVCDNCPVEANPDQADGNWDGGGDACEPSPVIGLFGDPIIPEPGVAPELLNPDLPHPLMPGIVHPVLQLSSALMDGHREALEQAGVTLHEPIAHNVFLISAAQARLFEIAEVPFVRSLFPLPPAYRAPEPLDGNQMRDCPILPVGDPAANSESGGAVMGDGGGLCPIVEVRFHQDVSAEVAEAILGLPDALVLQPGVTLEDRPVNSWQAIVLPGFINTLTMQDSVAYMQFLGEIEDFNDGSRQAIAVDMAQSGPWCDGSGCDGDGIVFSQWETRWAPGDDSPTPPPPPLPGGAGTHVDLRGRTIVRDLPTIDPDDPPVPAGCEGSIDCVRCTFSAHATHVAGTMMGNGTGDPAMAGMAPAGTNITYNAPSSVAELACELTDSAVSFGAQLSNNSWGLSPSCATAARYDGFSRAYDEQIRSLPEEAVVFAAANNQRSRLGSACDLPAIYAGPSTGDSCTPPPPGVVIPSIAEPAPLVRDRFFTLARGFGQPAKNTLVVGAVNSGAPSAPATLGRMTTFSSWGPTQDGRIKPDLVAAGAENNTRDGSPGDPDPQITSAICAASNEPNQQGTCISVDDGYGDLRGTSMAAPAVAGGAGLVLQHQTISGLVDADTPLDSDSLKALLVHTAVDLPVHFPLNGDFMDLEDCGGTGADCWPVPAIAPGEIQDGPDFVNGWGLVDIEAALSKVTAGNPPLVLQPSGCPSNVDYEQMPFNSPLALGGDPAALGISDCETTSIWDWVGYFDVPEGTTQLKVTIAWDDPGSPPPADGSTAPLLVNDLDLVVTPGAGTGGSFSPSGPHHYTWFLDPACPYLPAAQVTAADWSPSTYSDDRNTVEQVVVDNPDAGPWRVAVNARGLASPQPFAIMISTPPSVP